MSDLTVVIQKPTADTKIGLRLEDRKADGLPKIVAIAPGAAAYSSGQLKKGDAIVSVNGKDVSGHKRAAEVLKDAVGDIQLVIQRKSSSSRGSLFRKSSRSKSTVSGESGPVTAAGARGSGAGHCSSGGETVVEPASFDVDSMEYKAAVKVQAGVRGNFARKQTSEMAAEQEAAAAKAKAELEAAVMETSLLRSLLSRRKAASSVSARRSRRRPRGRTRTRSPSRAALDTTKVGRRRLSSGLPATSPREHPVRERAALAGCSVRVVAWHVTSHPLRCRATPRRSSTASRCR